MAVAVSLTGASQVATADGPAAHWVGAWATSPQAPSLVGISSRGLSGQTLRQIVHPYIRGRTIRLRISNAFGAQPLTLGHVEVACSAGGAQTLAGSGRTVTFDGSRAVTIPVGEQTYSDPVRLQLGDDQDLAISLYVPGNSGPATWHPDSLQTSYISTAGDHAADSTGLPFPGQVASWFWIDGVDVLNPAARGAIVLLGASAANGTGSTMNANHRLTDYLGERITAAPPGLRKSVLNAGIPGNKLLSNSEDAGPSALSRLETDVLDQTGVTDLIVFEANNDIAAGWSLNQITAAYMQIIVRSHARGLSVFGATLQPVKGSLLYSAQNEATRQAVNDWIRGSGAFDGVIDFDQAVRDPSHPERLFPAYDSGDHLHPNDAGYSAMADAVDLSSLLRAGLNPRP
jgi:lysophospholipase L1-like esterase